MGKQGLKEKDWIVLRALRWLWWMQTHDQIQNGGEFSPDRIRVDHHAVLHFLRRASVGNYGYDDAPKVNYRLKKLIEYGYVNESGYRYNRHYMPSSKTDPYIVQMVESVAEKAKRQEEEKEARIKWLRTTFDKLVPGNTVEIGTAYSYSHKGPVMSLQGPYSHLRIMMRLAEMQVAAQDAEADGYE